MVPFDIAGVRIAAIFLICFHHIAHYLTEWLHVDASLEEVRRFTGIGLCVFFILSGMSLRMMYRPVRSVGEYFDFVRHYGLRYAWPFFLLGTIGIALAAAFPSLFGRLSPGFSPMLLLLKPSATPTQSFWYIEVYCEICLVWPLLAKLIASTKHKWLIVALVYAIVYAMPVPLPFTCMLRYFFCYLPLFVIGALYGVGPRAGMARRTMIAALLWAASTAYLHGVSAPRLLWEPMTIQLTMVHEIARLAGSYALIGASGMFAGKLRSLHQIMHKLELATLDIYLLHTPFVAFPVAAAIALLPWRDARLFLIIALGAVVTMAFCTMVGLWIRRRPWPAYLLLGVGKRPEITKHWNGAVSASR